MSLSSRLRQGLEESSAAPLGFDPSDDVPIDLTGLPQGELARTESWTSTTPTSPDEEESADSASSPENPHSVQKKESTKSSRDVDSFGPFWQSDYSYG